MVVYSSPLVPRTLVGLLCITNYSYFTFDFPFRRGMYGSGSGNRSGDLGVCGEGWYTGGDGVFSFFYGFHDIDCTILGLELLLL